MPNDDTPRPPADPPPLFNFIPSRLHIYQCNAHRSRTTHHSILNDSLMQDFDVLMLTEPYTYAQEEQHFTLSHQKWNTFVPDPLTNIRPRTVIYVNTRITLTSYYIVPFPSRDIMIISFHTAEHTHPLTLINVYNPPETFTTLPVLTELITKCPQLFASDTPFVFMGDFNLHHSLWNDPTLQQPNHPQADDLLTIMASIGAQLRSQPAVHTFHNTQGNSSVIDLVFTSTAADHLYEACLTTHDPDFDHDSDHFPILHRIALTPPQTPTTSRINWKVTDWARLQDTITRHISVWEAPLPSNTSIDRAVQQLTSIIQKAIKKHTTEHRPSPYSKRWWNEELSTLRKRAAHARRLWKHSRLDEDHQNWITACRIYQEQLTIQKRNHWRNFLANIEDRTLYTAAKFTTKTPTPRHIPPIKTSNGLMANTPQDQAAVFHSTFFAPPAPPDLSDIGDSPTYNQLRFSNITITELDQAIQRMSPNKAPGPDNIPVLVLQKVWPCIRSPLLDIFTACIRIGFYPTLWRTATSLILRKPKRPDYSAPNAYRPIALLSTMGKLLEAVVAQRLTFLAEHLCPLPQSHIGCRPGRSTEDGITTVEEYIKHEWRKGNVVGALLIDVKNAFPSVSHPRLLHNLRERRIPEPLVMLIGSFLTNRRTTIKCSDYTSQLYDCTVGIPQGSPLSGILYLFYNAPLLTAHNSDPANRCLGWADDIIYLAAKQTVKQVRDILEPAGEAALQWGAKSASILDKIKTQYAYFTRNRHKTDDDPLRFGDALIPPERNVLYLGVILDRELRWKPQGERAINKAQLAILALGSLARTTWGIPMSQFQRLVTTCVHPRSDYAATVWHTFGQNTTITSKLDRVTKMAQRIALGAFRTTPSDALTYDSHIEPTRTRLDRRMTIAAIQLLTLPNTNPISPLAHRALKCNVKMHRTALQRIFHSASSFPIPVDLETIKPLPKPPGWSPNLCSHLAPSKKVALEHHANLPYQPTVFHLYSDGSKTDHGVGAGAVDLRYNRHIATRLGPPTRATVYESELVGIHLALQLAATLPTLATDIYIHLDNRAAIQSCTKHPRAQPAQHHLLKIHTSLAALRTTHPNTRFHLNWIPGHEGIPGNERADKVAKKAADDTTYEPHTPPYPALAAAARQYARAHFVHPPEHPQNGNHHRKTRGKTTSKHTVAMLTKLQRGRCSILVQLRSGHVGLRSYLARFGHADSPMCTRCKTPETVEHYLTTCMRYAHARSKLIHTILHHEDRTIRNKSKDIAVLLAHPGIISHTLDYISATGRFPLHTPCTIQQAIDTNTPPAPNPRV